ncbi:MAG: metallopeptidase TldD-related protein [Thermotogota bacterium]|nr:metallopeptidase TldD-related protein [Thermotogota bacterium]
MIERVIKLLKASDATCWKLQKNTVDSKEYFFVKKKMDLGRAKKVNHFDVTVYKDFSEEGQQYRGSSSVSLSPLLSLQELKEAIEGAVFAASFVKNPWYPIAEAYVKDFYRKDCDLGKLSKDSLAAVLKAQGDTKAWVNSAELFINDIQTKILNSEGLDVSYSKYQTYLETIVSASGNEEVELYDEFKLSVPDRVLIKERISGLLNMVHERSIAEATPTLKEMPVILTGEPVKEFMRYYFQQANSKMKYDKISQAEVGKSIQSKETGDKITMDILAEMEGSYYNSPVDDDGFLLKFENIVEKGLLKKYWGDLRYSHYLGVEPTGAANNFKVYPGEQSIEQLRETPHLEVTHFSAIDADMTTGDFGGEIRLGWYHDGSKKVPISGGSVTGNIRELSSMRLSKETHLEGDYFGPRSIKIEGFKISGE